MSRVDPRHRLARAALRIVLLALALAAFAAPATDEELRIVAPGDLRAWWTLDPASWRPAVQANEAARAGAGCAAVAFIVEADGRTSSVRVLRDTPEGRFAELAARIAAALRFAPADGNPAREPVYSYLTISFYGETRERLGSHVRRPIEVGDRVDRLCAVRGFAGS